MNKKRVGVITFHDYDNYGAILQSYALQRKLKEMGTYPEIIDYRCDYISNPFRCLLYTSFMNCLMTAALKDSAWGLPGRLAEWLWRIIS